MESSVVLFILIYKINKFKYKVFYNYYYSIFWRISNMEIYNKKTFALGVFMAGLAFACTISMFTEIFTYIYYEEKN